MRCASGREWAQSEHLPSQGDYPSTREFAGEGMGVLDSKAHVDVVELDAGSPSQQPQTVPVK